MRWLTRGTVCVLPPVGPAGAPLRLRAAARLVPLSSTARPFLVKRCGRDVRRGENRCRVRPPHLFSQVVVNLLSDAIVLIHPSRIV